MNRAPAPSQELEDECRPIAHKRRPHGVPFFDVDVALDEHWRRGRIARDADGRERRVRQR